MAVTVPVRAHRSGAQVSGLLAHRQIARRLATASQSVKRGQTVSCESPNAPRLKLYNVNDQGVVEMRER